jgi:molybdopterin synthase catalytic subunit
LYLTELPVDLGGLIAAVQSPDRGGIACFLGTVRNHHGGRDVLRLDYSAYAPMVEAECARIVAEAESRWDVSISLRHRIGRLEVGEVAVAVVAASAHRDEAFAACRHVIEELKRRVPVWKREYYPDGAVDWVDPTASSKDSEVIARGHSPQSNPVATRGIASTPAGSSND